MLKKQDIVTSLEIHFDKNFRMEAKMERSLIAKASMELFHLRSQTSLTSRFSENLNSIFYRKKKHFVELFQLTRMTLPTPKRTMPVNYNRLSNTNILRILQDLSASNSIYNTLLLLRTRCFPKNSSIPPYFVWSR